MEITKKQETVQVPTTRDYYELKLTYEELMVMKLLLGGVSGRGLVRNIVDDMYRKITYLLPYRGAPTFYNSSSLRDNSEPSQRIYLQKD